jgi:BirA family biotin operon repressor/biotin-[acetyl-CoA-carboxylase] ligase
MGANPYREIETAKPGTVGWRVHYVAIATSTQDVAAELARSGSAPGTVVIAETQSAGRGRKTHRWYSPPGVNLYLTVILRPRIDPAELPRLSLAAGVAVAQALESFAPGLVGLKWPNDIWLRGKKAGGILAQTMKVGARDETAVVLLGIGLNVNLEAQQIPIDLRGSATSLCIEVGKPCDRVRLAAALFEHLHKILAELETEGFSAIRARWERLSPLTGKTVNVLDCGNRFAGKVIGIDEDGALLLKTESEKPIRLRAGEVTLSGLSSP